MQNNITLQIVKDNIIRCVYDPLGNSVRAFTLTAYTPRSVPLPGNTAAETPLLTAAVEEKSGAVVFRKADGTVLLRESGKEFADVPVPRYVVDGEKPDIERIATVDGERNFVRNMRPVEDHTALRGRILYRFSEGEAIHGLGQGEDGVYDYRFHTRYLYQHNMMIPMPVFVSDRGYGVLFDCGCLMTFNDTECGSYMYFDAAEVIDYYFVYGETLGEIIAGFRFLTGRPVMLPKWAFGYIQSKECYRTAGELAEIAHTYRALGIPLDCVVQDWNTWEPGKWGQKTMDPARYGDAAEQIGKIHDMHVHTMVSIWPNMNTGTEDHTELLEAGRLLNDFTTYDAFDEKAREIYFRQAKRGLLDKGFDSWWCDSTEPFSGPDWGGRIKREPWERFQLVGEEHKKFIPAEKANLYSLMHAKGMFENQRKADDSVRVLNLTRSGYIGSQQYGAVLWSGDITASWETLKKQIAEGLNMAMTGYPYWTLDIGGFFTVGEKWKNRGCGCGTDPTPKWFWKGTYDDGVADRGYCELYVRWLQFGAFLPIFRSHGTDTPREIWQFGEKGSLFYDTIEKYIKLRYLLMPYIYSCAAATCLHDSTLMRSLLFDFPHDAVAAKLCTEYMFGKNFLVCPVTSPMYYGAGNVDLSDTTEKKWTVYLPAGTDWYNFHTMERYPGGIYTAVDAPMDVLPLFVKAGSIVPMRKGLTYADEENGTPLELHVYSGKDAEFTCYEDSGNGYAYENGAYAEVRILWNEKERALTMEERTGNFPELVAERPVTVYLNEKPSGNLIYKGSRTELRLG